jgi:hypothetical protein
LNEGAHGSRGSWFSVCQPTASRAKVAHALHNYGVVIVKDPRVVEADNNRFLDMVEKYFESSDINEMISNVISLFNQINVK